MNRYWEVFFEVYEALPRQGPGNRACVQHARALCRELPSSPAVLDLGCGVGGQTLHLAELLRGSIVAIHNHAPSIERLNAALTELKQAYAAFWEALSEAASPAPT
jgi:cyclopropane fatty-acyl-phospholipid synthase-like methyltransferase